MTQFGYTAMCEQTPVRQLVSDLQAAEHAGFDFSVMSDHYFPWLEDQGHSGYTWAVLGAAAQATHRLPLMTMVTCPTFRYHPAVVAQKAATVGVLSGGRCGQHSQVERGRLYHLPDSPAPIGIAASGTESAELAADQGDGLIAGEPDALLVQDFNQAGGTGKPKYGQLAICCDRTRRRPGPGGCGGGRRPAGR